MELVIKDINKTKRKLGIQSILVEKSADTWHEIFQREAEPTKLYTNIATAIRDELMARNPDEPKAKVSLAVENALKKHANLKNNKRMVKNYRL